MAVNMGDNSKSISGFGNYGMDPIENDKKQDANHKFRTNNNVDNDDGDEIFDWYDDEIFMLDQSKVWYNTFLSNPLGAKNQDNVSLQEHIQDAKPAKPKQKKPNQKQRRRAQKKKLELLKNQEAMEKIQQIQQEKPNDRHKDVSILTAEEKFQKIPHNLESYVPNKNPTHSIQSNNCKLVVNSENRYEELTVNFNSPSGNKNPICKPRINHDSKLNFTSDEKFQQIMDKESPTFYDNRIHKLDSKLISVSDKAILTNMQASVSFKDKNNCTNSKSILTTDKKITKKTKRFMFPTNLCKPDQKCDYESNYHRLEKIAAQLEKPVTKPTKATENNQIHNFPTNFRESYTPHNHKVFVSNQNCSNTQVDQASFSSTLIPPGIYPNGHIKHEPQPTTNCLTPINRFNNWRSIPHPENVPKIPTNPNETSSWNHSKHITYSNGHNSFLTNFGHSSNHTPVYSTNPNCFYELWNNKADKSNCWQSMPISAVPTNNVSKNSNNSTSPYGSPMLITMATWMPTKPETSKIRQQQLPCLPRYSSPQVVQHTPVQQTELLKGKIECKNIKYCRDVPTYRQSLSLNVSTSKKVYPKNKPNNLHFNHMTDDHSQYINNPEQNVDISKPQLNPHIQENFTLPKYQQVPKPKEDTRIVDELLKFLERAKKEGILTEEDLNFVSLQDAFKNDISEPLPPIDDTSYDPPLADNEQVIFGLDKPRQGSKTIVKDEKICNKTTKEVQNTKKCAKGKSQKQKKPSLAKKISDSKVVSAQKNVKNQEKIVISNSSGDKTQKIKKEFQGDIKDHETVVMGSDNRENQHNEQIIYAKESQDKDVSLGIDSKELQQNDLPPEDQDSDGESINEEEASKMPKEKMSHSNTFQNWLAYIKTFWLFSLITNVMNFHNRSVKIAKK